MVDVEKEGYSFEVIHGFVTLARSGDYLNRAALFRAMAKFFPELSEEDMKRVALICHPALTEGGLKW